jgi:selenocysteine-specific elongation factor
MELKRLILATAGHVDHGKSTLVRALTGIDPDRLPEEKLRGITIELGFAQLELRMPDALLSIGIVDVPGHEDFVKNMVAGVGSIDLALLVVAADDGWMPQTEEHLQILIYLGVRRIVVALTKIDLVESAAAAEEKVRAQLRDTPFADAAIVRTSITTESSIEELKAQLAREFSALIPQRDIGKPRLAVDRAFILRGIGTIVTGTLVGGRLRRGQAVVVQPAKIIARIRAIQNHNREVEEIGPGARTALSLPDVTVAQERNTPGVWRGNVITLSEFGEANAVVDVMVSRSSRLPAKTPPLKHGAVVRVHHGSGNFSARLFFQNRQTLAVGDSFVAELRFESPILAFVGDRFVVRDSSEQKTIAGGIVLDPDAVVKNFRTAEQKRFLQSRAEASINPRTLIETELGRDHVGSVGTLLTKSSLSADEVSTTLRILAAEGKIVLRGDLAIDSDWWRAARKKAFAAIDAEHETHPNQIGLDLTKLRGLFANEGQEMFDALVADLGDEGAIRIADVIKRAAHRPVLPSHLEMAGATIRRALAEKPFDPPSRKELAPDGFAQQALRFFLETGEVMEVGEDIVLSKEACEKMRDVVVDFLRSHGPSTLGELRQALGSSRRVIVPFLERLDHDNVTRRAGDKRTLTR